MMKGCNTVKKNPCYFKEKDLFWTYSKSILTLLRAMK